MRKVEYYIVILVILVSWKTSYAELDRTGTLWSPYIEWSFQNTTYSSNPFDLPVSATFTHSATGQTITTEMFYAGNDTWRLRFTGTRTGVWNFLTTSSDPDLNGHSGILTINPNPNPAIKGFLSSVGTKFIRQNGENSEVDPFIFNVYQGDAYAVGPQVWYNNPKALEEVEKGIREIEKYGCSVFYSGIIANMWFALETQRWDEHNSENPDLRTFEALETVIVYLHSRGMHLHIWAWGDESRRQTPIGVGGINGTPDRRLQRYIAARLGPLPGWSMGYGFDLQEWVTEAQIGSWAAYMHDHLGWQHLLWGRGRVSSELDAKSYSGRGPNSYADAENDISSDPNRPHIYEERFIFGRWGKYDMQTTRRQFWWNVMAGGTGSWWGSNWSTGANYPNPEQLITHQRFWDSRFLLNMDRANNLTDGYCLKSPDNNNFIFYKEDAASIQMDLSAMSSPQPAIAVDTKISYTKLDLGTTGAKKQTWTAPYVSDWAIAVGDFANDEDAPPAAPSELKIIDVE